MRFDATPHTGLRSLAVGLTLTVLGLTAGVWPADRPEASETTNRLAQNRLAQNRLAQNRLAQNRLAQNRLAQNRLAQNRLAQNGLTVFAAGPETAELLSTVEGRDVFAYMVSCALPARLAIQAEVAAAEDTAPPATLHTCADGRCRFDGALGLAESWVAEPLSPKNQRWVSACLLARVNRFEQAQSISLRGVAPELTLDDREAAAYVLEEGAFFGNLFAGGDTIDWNACRGRAQAAGEGGGLRFRDCAEEDPDNPGYTYCGFRYAGDCADYAPATTGDHACRGFDAEEGYYAECRSSAADATRRRYREVITTYTTR